MHNKVIGNVSNDLDFNYLKGCQMKCNSLLSCGHACNTVCHVEDNSHLMIKCSYACNK